MRLLGGTRLPTGSGGGRLLRPGQRGTQGLRHVSGTWDQLRPGLCRELRAPPVSAFPPVDRPRVLLSLQGNWELQLTSVGVRTTPPSAPPPWGDTGLTPAPTRSLRSIRGGGQPNSQTDTGLSRPQEAQHGLGRVPLPQVLVEVWDLDLKQMVSFPG